MAVREMVVGVAQEGLARGLLWGLQRRGDLGARLFDSRVRADPYAHYERIRACGPLVPTRMGLLAAGHPVVDRVLREASFGHGEPAPPQGVLARVLQPPLAPDLVDPVGPESMIGMDPPDHTRLRGLVSRVFSPRAIERLRPRVESLTAELLDRPAANGSMDLVTDLAAVLPVLVICEVLGVPGADRARFKAWGNDLASALDFTTSGAAQRRSEAALRALHGYFAHLFAERRRDPGDDLLSQLLLVEEAGDRLSPRELMATCLLLLLAGFETTVNLIGNGSLALLRRPDQLELLRERPELIRNAVEEMLLYDPPVQLTVRMALRDVAFGDRHVREGSTILAILGGANRDPAVFDEPGRFDVTRPNARRHLAFASGPHHCLGASLARLEGEVVFATLLDRFPSLSLAGEPRRRSTFLLRGLERLPLRVDADRTSDQPRGASPRLAVD